MENRKGKPMRKWNDPETWKRILEAMHQNPTEKEDPETIAAIRKGLTVIPTQHPRAKALRKFLTTYPEYRKKIADIIHERDRQIAEYLKAHGDRIYGAAGAKKNNGPPKSERTVRLPRGPRKKIG